MESPTAVALAGLLCLLHNGHALPSRQDAFHLRIIHNNDMHSRFEQTSQLSGKCSDYEAENNMCYGGFGRVLTAAANERQRAQEQQIPLLFLNAGDSYQGSTMFTVYKWKVVAKFINMLGIDVMSLGNHEFDDGVEGLVPYLYNITIPVVTCNLGLDEEPTLAATPLIPSIIFNLNGRKIGIIGYLTPETKLLADIGKVQLFDEVQSISKEAAKLKEEGANILIALGHSGYEADLKIAREVSDIDVVVGGHTNTFLYTGKPPDIEIPAAPYPNIITQSSGRKVPVVQAYAYTKYLGVLDVVFDDKGEVVEATGNPILLDGSIKQDPRILAELENWIPGVENITKEEIGKTRVLLDGGTCRFVECNLGNLITDAFVHYGVQNFAGTNWTNAPIALDQGGGIRSSIDIPRQPGVVTREDIMIVLPFFNAVEIVKVQGKYLLQALEWSVERYDPNMIVGRGEFLQVSGIQVVYDISQPVGQRVVVAKARCAACNVPRFQPIDPEGDYNVILPSFLARGGDNYTMFQDHGVLVAQFDALDTDIVADFVKERYLLYDDVEGRIVFTIPNTIKSAAGTVILTPILLLLLPLSRIMGL